MEEGGHPPALAEQGLHEDGAEREGWEGWSVLPREVEALVLQRLPPLLLLRLATVCSSWHRMAKAAHTWREMHFGRSGRMRARFRNEHLSRLCIAFGTVVRRVTLRGLNQVTDHGVNLMLQWCPHLVSLTLMKCRLVTPQVVAFCAHNVREEFAELRLSAQWAIALPLQLRMPDWLANMKKLIDKCGAHLRVLEMRMQSVIDENTINNLCSYLAIRCSRLQEVCMDFITSRGLETLILNCPNLCVVKSTTGINFNHGALGFRRLRSVYERASSLTDISYLITSQAHLPMVKTAVFTQIKALELSGSDFGENDESEEEDSMAESNTDDALSLYDILSALPQLRHLGLTHFAALPSITLDSAFHSAITQLTSLNLEGSCVSSSTLEAIGRDMIALEKISFADSELDDDLIEAFSRYHNPLTSRVRCFRVDATAVTLDTGVKRLAKACPRLESVGSYGPSLTTDGCLGALSALQWRTLCLFFARSSSVTSGGLQHFFRAGGGRKARKIIISGPGISLDASALTVLLEHSQCLKKLRISSMASIDDVCLRILVNQAPPSLQYTRIMACPVTEEEALRLMVRAPFDLEVRYTPHTHQVM